MPYEAEAKTAGLSQGKPVLEKRIKKIFSWTFIVIVIIIPLGLGSTFPNTSKLLICLITHTLPDPEHLARIRNDLENQESFMKMLVKHEKSAVRRFNEAGDSVYTKKYIHKTPTSMFDIHAFHDYWEVWVRTDIINGKPFTSFLVRLGLIKDTNAEAFFSNQCDSDFCKAFMTSLLAIYNKMFEWGIFKPIRLNITELDATSTVSRKRVELNEWNEMVRKLHEQEIGISFINFHNVKI